MTFEPIAVVDFGYTVTCPVCIFEAIGLTVTSYSGDAADLCLIHHAA